MKERITKMTTNINVVLKEMKELQAMEAELKAEIEKLKAEAVTYMVDNDLDEIVTDDFKACYTTVLSNKFQTSAFKKVHMDLYKAFTKQTEYKRFTLN